MNQVKDFFAKHRNPICVFITVVLIFFFICTVSKGVVEKSAPTKQFGADDVNSFSLYFCTTSDTDNGDKRFSVTGNDPQFYIPVENADFNKLVFKFGEKYSGTIQVYYSDNGVLSEQNSVIIKVPEKDNLIVYLPTTGNTTIRIDIDRDLVFDTLVLENSERTIKTKLNIAPLIVVLVVLAILIACEKFVGFFAWIKHAIYKLYLDYKTLFLEKKYLLLSLKLLMSVLLATWIISVVVAFMLCCFVSAFKVYLFLLSVLLLLDFLTYSFLSKNTNPAKLFVVTMVVIGVALSFSIPVSTGVSFDDQVHYQWTVGAANYLFGTETTLFDYNQTDCRYSKADFSNLESFMFDDMQLAFRQWKINGNLYKSVGHLPGAISLGLSRLMGVSGLASSLLIKLANTFCYAGILYCALKKLKGGALIFASVAMLPSAVYLVTNYSYDWWITAFVAYAFAYYFSELQSPEKIITVPDCIKIFGAMWIGTAPKLIYIFLAAIMVFMPKKKFTKENYKWLYRAAVVLLIASVLLSYAIPFLGNSDDYTDNRGDAGTSSGSQLDFIFANPFRYVRILIKYLLQYVSFANANEYISNYVFLGNSAAIFGTFAILIMLFVAFVDKSEKDDFKYSFPFKAWSWLIFSGMLVLIATSMYISFTPVGHPTVNGCQYRYIFPALFAVLYMLGPVKIKNNIDKDVLNIGVFSALSLNIMLSFWDVYMRLIV